MTRSLNTHASGARIAWILLFGLGIVRPDPVAESELGEAQYYRLPARSIELGTTIGL